MADDIADIVGDDDKSQDIKEDIAKITEGKYKSASELAKAYKDLEKKFGETSEEIKKSREFAQIVQPLLDEIRADPEIFDKLDKKLRDKNDPKNKDNKDDKKDTKANEEARETMSNLIVTRFEESHKFSEMTKDEQADLRKKIGTEIMELTGLKLEQIDLRRQEQILEKAYKLVTNENKSSSSTDSNDDAPFDGAIGSLNSSQGKGQKTLSSEEAKVAEKLGLTREQYIAGRK
jgi:hypothetical protein